MTVDALKARMAELEQGRGYIERSPFDRRGMGDRRCRPDRRR